MQEAAGHAGLPLLFAFQAGLLTAVSPCAFAMLPAYVSYHLGAREEGFRDLALLRRLGRALLLAGIASLGFGLLFGGVGLVAVLGGRAVLRGVTGPAAGIGLGALLVALGFALLVTGRSLSVPLRLSGAPPGRGLVSSFVFGSAYGFAALSCMMPLYLLVIVNALSGAGVRGAAAQFGSYTAGMAAVLGAVATGAALFRGIVAVWLRRLVPHVEWASAALLVLAGGYIIAYWIGPDRQTVVGYARGLGLALATGVVAATALRWLLERRMRRAAARRTQGGLYA